MRSGLALSPWGRGRVVPPGMEAEKVDVSCGASQDPGSPTPDPGQGRQDEGRGWLTARAPWRVQAADER